MQSDDQRRETSTEDKSSFVLRHEMHFTVNDVEVLGPSDCSFDIELEGTACGQNTLYCHSKGPAR